MDGRRCQRRNLAGTVVDILAWTKNGQGRPGGPIRSSTRTHGCSLSLWSESVRRDVLCEMDWCAVGRENRARRDGNNHPPLAHMPLTPSAQLVD